MLLSFLIIGSFACTALISGYILRRICTAYDLFPDDDNAFHFYTTLGSILLGSLAAFLSYTTASRFGQISALTLNLMTVALSGFIWAMLLEGRRLIEFATKKLLRWIH